MTLTQILHPTCVKVPLEGKDKYTVITELLDLLDVNGLLQDRESALEAVFVREKTRSTGIGSGIANSLWQSESHVSQSTLRV
jgi:mannitol/fructose-specific phosphotransferase system IIA component (Ntr-type)